MKKQRADELVLERASLENLELARALIMEGRVLSGSNKIMHPGDLIDPAKKIRVLGLVDTYVSRGAYKLKKAMEAFCIDLKGITCMDIGASTGGFTDIMLRAGAKKVYAVDVGYNLLDYRIRSNERVIPMEHINAKHLTKASFPDPVFFGASDVSFISLKKILPPVFSSLQPGSRFVALVKPQFEAPPDMVGERGIVRDRDVHAKVLQDITEFVEGETSWRINGLECSPIQGREGNVEFLLDLVEKENAVTQLRPWNIDKTVNDAYYKFIKSN